MIASHSGEPGAFESMILIGDGEWSYSLDLVRETHREVVKVKRRMPVTFQSLLQEVARRKTVQKGTNR